MDNSLFMLIAREITTVNMGRRKRPPLVGASASRECDVRNCDNGLHRDAKSAAELSRDSPGRESPQSLL